MGPSPTEGPARGGQHGALLCLLLCLAATAACASAPDDTSPTTEPDLSQAVQDGDLGRVQQLLEDGADPDQPVVSGFTPLMRAAGRDDADATRVLVEGGAEVDRAGIGGLTAVHVAARSNSPSTLEVLLAAGADPAVRTRSGHNALDHAAEEGAVDSLAVLADRDGLSLDQPSEVVTQGHGYPRDVGPTPLALAARAGEREAVEALLTLGADVDGRSRAGHTPLLTAVFSGQSPELVELLLEAGADVEATARCERGCSEGGGEALTVEEWAVALSRSRLVELLDARRSPPTS